jgi:hypothetical protein
VLDGHFDDPGRTALALRMLGGVHALVLTGRAPELAIFYPSAGGTADPGAGAGLAWAAMRRVLAEQLPPDPGPGVDQAPPAHTWRGLVT